MTDERSAGPFFPSHLSPRRDVFWIASIALVYFAAARLGLSIDIEPEGIAPVWLPSGIFLSAVLLSRSGLRPWLAVVLWFTDFAAELLAGTPWHVSAIYSTALTADALLSAWLLVRFLGEPIAFSKTREIFGFLVLSIGISNAAMSLVAASAATLIPGTSFWNSWRWWAASDGIGSILVTPFILSWADLARTRPGVWNMSRVLEGAALSLLTACLNLFGFGYLSDSGMLPLLLPFCTFPFLLWGALRFGIRGVTSTLAVLAVIVIPFAVAHRFPDLFFYGAPLDDTIVVQLYLAMMAIPSLLLGAVVSERELALQRLRETDSLLNKAEEIASVGSWELDHRINRLTWSDEVYRIFGMAPQVFGATYQAFLDAVHPEDRTVVDEAYARSLRDSTDAYDIEHRIVRKRTGEVRFVREKCEHTRDASGRVIRSIGMVHDITEHKLAEKTLRDSEARFRAIFEDSPIAIWEEDFSRVKERFDELRRSGVTDFRIYLDANPNEVSELSARVRIVDVNQATVRLLKAESKISITSELPRYFTPESMRVFQEELIALAEGKTTFRSETIHLTALGESVILDLTVSVQPGYGETLSRVLASCFDITDRVRAVEALRELSQKNEEALRVAQMGHWEFDVESGLFTFNDQYYRLHGTTAPEAGGYRMTAVEFARGYVHPDDAHKVQDAIGMAIGSDDPGFQFQTEARILRVDGSVRTVIVWFRIEKDARGKTIKLYGVNQDVSERRQAQAELRASEARFRALIEQAGDGFELLDANGRFLDVNSATCRQLGYTREELLQMSFTDVDPVISREVFAERFQSLQDRQPMTFESVHRRKDGTTFPIEISTSVIRLGDARNAVTLVRDISGRKRAEQEREKLHAQLMQAQKMESVGRLAGGVAHDFNNMLGVILGHAELALADVPAEGPLRSSLEEIQAAALRSAELTRQLLAYARKQTIAPRVLDLNDAVAGTLKMLHRLIGEDIELAWLPGANLWKVKMDPAQIDQILANLCVNARDAISGVGKVTIETENVVVDDAYSTHHPEFVAGEYVMLGVSDNGAGMSPAVVGHLFEPFFTTKDVGRGTGLGLATVYGIVKQNEGFINVYSEPDKGTTFKVYIPRYVVQPMSEPAERGEESPRGGTETVLLVEDEKMILKLGKSLLGLLGYTVLAAQTPNEALTVAEQHRGPIHLLITDVVMPQMNGKELRERLALLRPEMKTLYMSGYTANTIAHHGVLEPGVQFLQKPFSIKGLSSKVREALDGPAR